MQSNIFRVVQLSKYTGDRRKLSSSATRNYNVINFSPNHSNFQFNPDPLNQQHRLRASCPGVGGWFISSRKLHSTSSLNPSAHLTLSPTNVVRIPLSPRDLLFPSWKFLFYFDKLYVYDGRTKICTLAKLFNLLNLFSQTSSSPTVNKYFTLAK